MLQKGNPGRDQKRDSLESVAKRMRTNVDWQGNSDSFEWKTNRIAKVFHAIFTKFISAIDSMENHPTSGKSGKRQRTHVKRNIILSDQQDNISKDDMVMIKQIRHMIETDMLGKNYTNSREKRFIVCCINFRVEIT